MMYGSIGNVSSHLHSSSATTALARNPTIPYTLPPPTTLPPFAASGGHDDVVADDDEFPTRDERLPQWSNQETSDFIEIRAQLEWEFTTAKRNKNLWEMVANRMREKGYRRTPDQCKCKWKNLVTRYKGQKATDMENVRLCPFFDELHAMFTMKAYRMQQAQVDAETAIVKGRKRLKNVCENQSHENLLGEREDEETDVDQAGKGTVAPKRRSGGKKQQKIGEENCLMLSATNVNKNDTVLNSLREMMRNFIQQQQRIDMQWRESMEKHAEERGLFEQEWRQNMEKLERERLVMEQASREREEQRRLREESRAEKRGPLLTTLLNKLICDKSP